MKNEGAERAFARGFLPDGRHFLFRMRSLNPERAGIYVGSVEAGRPKRLLALDTAARYSSGFLLFVRDGSLLAQAFDTDRLQLSGNAKLVVPNVTNFSASQDGLLAYYSQDRLDRILWLDRTGKEISTIGEPGVFLTFDLSPDAARVVVSRREANNPYYNLWIVDAVRGGMSPLTRGPFDDYDPRWSPNGTEIVFDSTRDATRSPFRIAAGGGQATRIFQWQERIFALDAWSPDGKYLLFHDAGGRELWMIPLAGDPKPVSVIKTLSGTIEQTQFSPDMRWIAFNANESGRFDVWVTPFPPTGKKWQITTNGGVQPRWRGDGKELFYLTLDGTLTAVDVHAERDFEVGAPHPLFATHLQAISHEIEQYGISPDGQRILLIAPAEPAAKPSCTVIVNWPALLRK